jgi:hypothetical protein
MSELENMNAQDASEDIKHFLSFLESKYGRDVVDEAEKIVNEVDSLLDSKGVAGVVAGVIMFQTQLLALNETYVGEEE